jgi:hypothetical protein
MLEQKEIKDEEMSQSMRSALKNVLENKVKLGRALHIKEKNEARRILDKDGVNHF